MRRSGKRSRRVHVACKGPGSLLLDTLLTACISFRWVECQLKSLASCPQSEYHLGEVLKSLPPSLDETYNRMLMSIEGASKSYAQRILTLLCVSTRPLSAAELIDGIAVNLGTDPKFDPSRRLQDTMAIQEICSGLVETDDSENISSPIVRIAHYSVQEYLTSDRILFQPAKAFSVNLQEAHAEMAQICLVYLINTLDERVLMSRFEVWPFIHYAALYWVDHFRSSGLYAQRADALVLILPKSRTALGDWARGRAMYPFRDKLERSEVEKRLGQRVDGNVSPLYCASALRLPSVVRALIDTGADVNERGGMYGNAVTMATRQGHAEIVQLLIDNGAKVNAQNEGNTTALRLASELGHEKVVKVLLDGGADTSARKSGSDTPLQAASFIGHEKIVRLLLDRGADLHAQQGYQDTALTGASYGGHEKIVQLLLDRGAEANEEGGSHGSALIAASYSGHEKVVQVLLDRGAEVNTRRGEQHDSALRSACFNFHGNIVQLLLGRGADINAVNRRGQTVLDETLDRTAYRNRMLAGQTNPGRRVLFEEFREKCVKMIDLLRQHGAIEMDPVSWRESRAHNIRTAYNPGYEGAGGPGADSMGVGRARTDPEPGASKYINER